MESRRGCFDLFALGRILRRPVFARESFGAGRAAFDHAAAYCLHLCVGRRLGQRTQYRLWLLWPHDHVDWHDRSSFKEPCNALVSRHSLDGISMTGSYRCWAEIDIQSLRHNIRIVRSMIPQGARVIAVVKADAYGHGLPEIAFRLDNDVDLFGVANLVEAQTIRATGATPQILILSPALPDERQIIVNEKFVPT